jgi:RNA polymerase sigma-70 factor, ECF subfamily
MKMRVVERSDNMLIEGFLAGSINEFEELISRYETKVYNLSFRLTKNQEDAQEVLQDVFVTLYKKLPGFEGKSAFSSWLYRITVNASFMKLRKRKNQTLVSFDEVYPNLPSDYRSENDYGAKTDTGILRKQLRDALSLSISRLPEEYKAVFILRDIDGLSNKEVGDILNLSIPAVKSRLHRSRVMLRRRLKRYYDDIRSTDKVIATAHGMLEQWNTV